MNRALLLNLASTLFLTGLAWSLALVQLPILFRGDYPELELQLRMHRYLNTKLMVLPMAIEFVTAIWLIVLPPTGVGRGILGFAAALICVIFYATVWYSMLHRKLRHEYNQPVMNSMRMWNLVRTAGWTVRSGLLLWIVSGG